MGAVGRICDLKDRRADLCGKTYPGKRRSPHRGAPPVSAARLSPVPPENAIRGMSGREVRGYLRIRGCRAASCPSARRPPGRFRQCQSASKIAPLSASRTDPPRIGEISPRLPPKAPQRPFAVAVGGSDADADSFQMWVSSARRLTSMPISPLQLALDRKQLSRRHRSRQEQRPAETESIPEELEQHTQATSEAAHATDDPIDAPGIPREPRRIQAPRKAWIAFLGGTGMREHQTQMNADRRRQQSSPTPLLSVFIGVHRRLTGPKLAQGSATARA
jgi:hypothetical protein